MVKGHHDITNDVTFPIKREGLSIIQLVNHQLSNWIYMVESHMPWEGGINSGEGFI